jgi:hypothetical protein
MVPTTTLGPGSATPDPTGYRTSFRVANDAPTARTAGSSFVVGLRLRAGLKRRSQLRDLLAQLSHLAPLVDQFGGEPAQRHTQSRRSKLGICCHQAERRRRGGVRCKIASPSS